MGVEWKLACTGCREFLWPGSMKPWKWRGFQLGGPPVVAWFGAHAREGCAIAICVDDLRERALTLEGADGWREDLRSFGHVEAWSLGDGPRCGWCARAIAPTAPDVVALGHLWLCDARCRDGFAAAEDRLGGRRVWRPDVAGAVDVRCERCDTGVAADPGEPLALAEWMLEHLDPACVLRVTLR
ncbi:MAG: hypothetical protein ABMB14_14755 [Myxococcota bacterium]